MDRRTFLMRASGAMVTLSASIGGVRPTLAAGGAGTPFGGEAAAGLSAGQWRTLAAVQDHLFPSEPAAPGAKDVDALGWLLFVLSAPDYDPADRESIKRGAVELQRIARDLAGAPFHSLDQAQREAALRRLEKTPGGAQWIGTILDYILEALFTDPVYGGNPNGIGWKWIEHQPGYRRPPAEKRYFLL